MEMEMGNYFLLLIRKLSVLVYAFRFCYLNMCTSKASGYKKQLYIYIIEVIK